MKCMRSGLCFAFALAAVPAGAQTSVLTSIHANGRLSWTNPVNTNALYHVEWAPQTTGPWFRTFANIASFDSHSHTGFAVDVPMFFRVVSATNPPPTGMVWIDGGDVELGQTGVEHPVHTNFISGFWMDEMEVSLEKWLEVYAWATNNGYGFVNPGSGKTNNHPVHTINWYDCVKWCNARSQREGLNPVYRYVTGYVGPNPIYATYRTGQLTLSNSWVNWSANGYRLPTEAEWEKAARGGRQRRLFPWGGDTIQHAWANYYSQTNQTYDTSPTRDYHPMYDNSPAPYTSPCGSFPANGYGLHDMAGNVMEWCWDWRGVYSTAYAVDPRGPATGTDKIQRGGSWQTVSAATRCADRIDLAPTNVATRYGFRTVRGP